MKFISLNKNITLTLILIILVLTSTTACVLSFSGYDGNETYSTLNFLISELGNKYKSPLFLLFNLSLITSGILLLFIIVKTLKASFVVKYSLLLSAIGLIGVGVFPEHYSVTGHLISASVFFASSACSISKSTYEQIKMEMTYKRRCLVIISFLTLFLFGLVYFEPKQQLMELVVLKENFVRPNVWQLAMYEWSYACLFIAWFFMLQVNENSD